jgi:hypothetical protein
MFFLSTEKPTRPSRSGVLIGINEILVAPLESFNGNATTTGRSPEPSHSGELRVTARNPSRRDWDDCWPWCKATLRHFPGLKQQVPDSTPPSSPNTSREWQRE